MADYHIYLHSEENGSSGSKTKPFSAKENENKGEGFTAVRQAFSTAKNAVTGGAASMGVAALTKVVPWIAIGVVIAKTTEQVLVTGFSHQEEYTGNYRNAVNAHNSLATLSMYLNPIGTIKQFLHKEAQFKKQNTEITQQNRLIGNTILKDFNIGV